MRFCMISAVVVVAATAALSQARPERPPRLVTPTRLVSVYAERENQLLGAEQKKDAAALGRMTAEDFALWTAEGSGDPVDREEWIRAATAGRVNTFRIRRMAAQSFGEADIVSFVLTKVAGNGRQARESSSFVVDVWIKENGEPKLATRYASAIATPAGPVRPTGKQ